jgi:transcriptional regulator with XRE-family HTH domain
MGKKINAKTAVERVSHSYSKKESDWNDKVYLQEIGKRLKTMREDRNISQAELARVTGMKVPNISVIECGKSNPQLLTILRLVGAMDGDLTQIFPIPHDLSFIISTPKVYKPRKHLLKKK